MKKLIVVIAIASGLFITGFGNQEGSKEPGTNPPAEDSFANSTGGAGSAVTGTPTAADGSKLIASGDCKTCHNLNEKMTGPSYKDIAKKYGNSDAMADELSLKIINGGSGRWGNVAMPPHQNFSTAEAKAMAQFILSLNTQ